MFVDEQLSVGDGALMFLDVQYFAGNGASTFVDAQYSTRNGVSTFADVQQSAENGASKFIDAHYSTEDGASAFADTQHSQVNGASTFSDAPLSFPWLHLAMHKDVILILRNRLLWGVRKIFGRFLNLDGKGFGNVGDFCYNCTSYSNLKTRLFVPSHGHEQREQLSHGSK